MSTSRLLTAIAALSLVCSAYAAESLKARAVDSGIAVDVTVKPLAGPLREGAPVHVTVKVTDATTGAPVRGINPAAWLKRRGEEPPADRKTCVTNVATFVTGNMLNPATLDLNIYHVVTLNEDPTLSVVDPRFGFGGSRLLSLVELESQGHDWTQSVENDRLFVTMPESNLVAAVDTVAWRVLKNIDAGREPRRIAMQPGTATAWVATADGLAAIRVRDLSATRVPIAGGVNELAFSEDGRYLVATTTQPPMATLIETKNGKTLGTFPLASTPVSVAFSSASGMAYVVATKGEVTIVDPKSRRVRGTVTIDPDPTRIRFAPGGRYAFIIYPSTDYIEVFDAASATVIQRGKFDSGPFEVTFSDTLAFVRHLNTDLVLMVPLPEIGHPGKAISVIDFPAGQEPFGKAGTPTPADGIVNTPGDSAVLVANAPDRSIYYYREGMAAPVGTFKNYGRMPRAVTVVDRTLREIGPGTFATTTRLPESGRYDAAVFVDSPRVVTCFDMTIADDPERAAKRAAGVKVEPLIERRIYPAGKPLKLAFRLTDKATGRPLEGLADARILSFLASGGWQKRQALTDVGEGKYETVIEPPEAGVYYVYVESAMVKLKASNPQFLTLEVAK